MKSLNLRKNNFSGVNKFIRRKLRSYKRYLQAKNNGELVLEVVKFKVQAQWKMHDFDINIFGNYNFRRMYDTEEVNSFRYAQMQSSILNKTGASRNSATSNKSNLISKFSLLE